MKRPSRPGSMASLGEVLPVLYEELHLDKKVQELSLLALWPKLVGESYAAYTKATGLKRKGRKTVLYVKVANAALASDLSFQLPAIQETLNQFQPQTGLRIDQIQLQVGTVV